MLGAIAGDVIGSVYEWNNIRTKSFPLFDERCRFTDDTVLTVAVADALLGDGDVGAALLRYHARYPDAGYGTTFTGWVRRGGRVAAHSASNGAAMRISPVGAAFASLAEVMAHAERVTRITHDHPEAVKGAQATASAAFLARSGRGRDAIRDHVERTFGYDLSVPLDRIRPTYTFDVTCQGTVPQALRAFLESVDFEDAIRNAVSLGGDTDTLACITGGVAEAFYGGVPEPVATRVLALLDAPLRDVTLRFVARHGPKGAAR